MTLADAEDLPAHGAAIKARFGWKVPSVTGIDDLPIRDELRGKTPYGAPQLDVPVQLNTNENPYPLPAELVERIAERVAEARAASTATPTGTRSSCAPIWPLSDPDGPSTRRPENVWAANGSNEVIQQLLQTFGGPGRTAMGFEPSYSMHALISRGTGTGWIPARAGTTSPSTSGGRAAIAEHRPDIVFITSPNNPTGTAVEAETVLALTSGAAAKPRWCVSTRRTPSSATAPRAAAARGPPAAGRHPHDVQGVRVAGPRLGYLAADPAVVDAVQLVRLPYHLSAVTQAAARAALEHAELLGDVEQLRPSVTGWSTGCGRTA